MPTYSGSKAQAGRGSTLAIGATPVTIGEVTTTGISGAQWNTVDTTNMQSGPDAEFLSTIRQNGTLKVDGNRVSSDAGQIALEAAFASGAVTPFTLTLPKTAAQTTTGDVYSFSALVEGRDFSSTRPSRSRSAPA